MNIEDIVFGEEQQIRYGSDLLPFLECAWKGGYYHYPFSASAVSKFFGQGVHLRSAVAVKKNILMSSFIPNALLNKTAFARLVLDDLWFGNAYVERVSNRRGGIIQLRHSPAKYTRRGKADDEFVFTQNTTLEDESNLHHFERGSVFHLLEPDVNQDIYGLPEWLPAAGSAALNDAATFFRLRYYRNGSHSGYILYITDPEIPEKSIDNLKNALKQSRGPGNFKNLLLHSPGSNNSRDNKGVQILPISEVTAKDEFFNIKSVTRDDQLASQRVPPNLMGIVPSNTSGFGSVTDAAKVFARNEIVPLQEKWTQLNDWLGIEVVKFDPYVIEKAADQAQ